jgi:hypothetical protein
LTFTHIIAFVGGDDDVGGLNDTLEVLIHSLTIDLQFKDTSVDLVDEEDGLDLLTKSLTEHGFGLHTDTFDVVDDDEGTISNTEGSSNFSGEINVTGGINQVDKIGFRFTIARHNVGLEVKRDTS